MFKNREAGFWKRKKKRSRKIKKKEEQREGGRRKERNHWGNVSLQENVT